MIPKSPGSMRYFTLRVIDAASDTAYDQALVYFNSFNCKLGQNSITKGQKDTERLQITFACTSPFGPDQFLHWESSLYLSDSTDPNARCWPPDTRWYRAFYKNSLGCINSYSTCVVYIRPTGVGGTPLLQHTECIIAPNPLNSESQLQSGPDWWGGTLRIFGADGRRVGTMMISYGKTTLTPLLLLPPGLYFYEAQSPAGRRAMGKFLRQ